MYLCEGGVCVILGLVGDNPADARRSWSKSDRDHSTLTDGRGSARSKVQICTWILVIGPSGMQDIVTMLMLIKG